MLVWSRCDLETVTNAGDAIAAGIAPFVAVMRIGGLIDDQLRDSADLGTEIVCMVAAVMGVDPAWSATDERGFTRWEKDHEQRLTHSCRGLRPRLDSRPAACDCGDPTFP